MSFRSVAARAGSAAHTAARPSVVARSSFAMAQHRTLYDQPLPPVRFSTPTCDAIADRFKIDADRANRIRERKADEANDVVFESKYGLRTVMLNRPKKLNSLNSSMIRKIVPRLVEWEKSDLANVIVLKGAGEKALCAGGDVTALAEFNKEEDGWKKSTEYFGLEYKLDHLIATYGKPYISFMDGITMGGGVGLSLHAPFRIATERTVFAMPETTIGFFPDVGASFFLPRLNGSLGTYLALTSDRVTGANVFYSGIATHYLHSTSLPDLENRLAELRFRDDAPMAERLGLIGDALEEYATGLPFDQPIHLAGELRRAIDRCFSKETIEEILAALQQESGEMKEWAQKQIATLQKRSPTAVHVTLRQMRSAKPWSIAETFKNEYKMAMQCMRHPDFTEGVTALLVRKEKPNWQPATLEAVAESGDPTEPFFDFKGEGQLELLSERSYNEYPFGSLGVPTETEVKFVIQNKAKQTPVEVLRKVVSSRDGRQGIEPVVREIMDRMTQVDEKGHVRWAEDDGVTSKL